MTGARSFVRLAFAGFFVSSLIVACTVKNESTDTTVSCHPGDYKDCSCSGSSKPGQKECNDEGNGYEACHCDGSVDAGGGTGDAGAGPVSTGGTTSYAGTTNGGSISYAGEPAGGAGSGAGPVEIGGAGGSGGDVTPLECQDPANDCETCYFGGCCEQYAPCVNDADGKCLQEVADVLACTDDIKATRNVKTEDLVTCAQQVGATQGTWSDSLSPLTVDVVNCIAGEPGWDNSATWGPLACKASCFDK